MLWLSILIGCITLVVSLIIFLSNRDNHAGRIFALFALIMGVWVVISNAVFYVPNEELALLCMRLTMAITPPLLPILFVLSKIYPNGQLNFRLWQKIAMVMIAAITILAALSPWMFIGVTWTDSSISPQLGPLIVVYALNVAIFMPLTLINFYQRWRRAKGLAQLQLKYIIFGLLFAFLSALVTNFVLVVLFNNSNFLELGTLLATVFMVLVPSYPLLQQRLFGVEFIVSRILYYTILVTLVLGVLFALLFLHEQKFIFGGQVWLEVSLAALVLLSILYLGNIVKKIIDKKLIQHGRDFVKMRVDYLRAVNREVSLVEIVNKLFDVIEQTLGVRKQAFYLEFSRSREKRLEVERRLKILPTEYERRTLINFWDDFNLASQFLMAQENIAYKLPIEKQNVYWELKKIMAKYRVEIIFPVFINQHFQGVILLGKKENGVAFYAQDINYLQALMEATIPILGRAILYDQMNHFNELLKSEVSKKNRNLNKAYQELEFAYMKLQRLDKAKDDFVSVASHELRTPMTAIRNSIFMAQREPEVAKNPKLKRFLEITYNSTQRLIKLVNDMLTISRIEAERADFGRESFNLLEVAQQVHLEVESIAKEKNIYLKIEARAKQFLIKGDREKMHEVVMNLVGNALKFTIEGGVKIKLRKTGARVLLEVEDTGIGIKEEDLSKLFEKFTKLENSYVKVAENGTGLGLHIAKQIVEKHRGKITATSVFGQGSVFTVDLPEEK